MADIPLNVADPGLIDTGVFSTVMGSRKVGMKGSAP
jgi:hypothetical protein